MENKTRIQRIQDRITDSGVLSQIESLSQDRIAKGKDPFNDEQTDVIFRLTNQLFLPHFLENGESFDIRPWNVSGTAESDVFNRILEGVEGRARSIMTRNAQNVTRRMVKEARSLEQQRINDGLSEMAEPGDPDLTDRDRGAFLRRPRKHTRHY